MVQVYKCDKCKNIVTLIFKIEIPYFSNDFNANIYAIYFGIKRYNHLCKNCILKLDKWMNDKK